MHYLIHLKAGAEILDVQEMLKQIGIQVATHTEETLEVEMNTDQAEEVMLNLSSACTIKRMVCAND